jgi:hypothetical protein
MTQLEQELSALFADAASRVEIRPMPSRSPQRVFVNKVLAAGLAAAVVAGIVVVATRFGSDRPDRGGALTPASTRLLADAVARTMAEPLRIEETFTATLTGSAPGSSTGNSVVELDATRHEFRITKDGSPYLLLVDKHLYVAIPEAARQATGNPNARWQEMSLPTGDEDSLFSAGSTGLYALQKALQTDKAKIDDLGDRRFHVTLDGAPSMSPGQAGAAQELDMTVHLSRDGYVDRVRTSFQLADETPGTATETARVSLLNHDLRLSRPDPATVVAQSALIPGSVSGGSAQPCPQPTSTTTNGTEVNCTMMQAVPMTGRSTGKARRPSNP